MTVSDFNRGLLVRVFTGAQLPGSPQQVHFFVDEPAARRYQSAVPVVDDIDHSYVYPDQGDYRVSWANRAGPIQFCGSGAFAIAWLLSVLGKQSMPIKLAAGSLCLRGMANANSIGLLLPKRETRTLDLDSMDRYAMAADGSGIYLCELADSRALEDAACYERAMAALSDFDVHALCVFHWDRSQSSGRLRYFVPRYGRPEDAVTGSIQSLLTPLVARRYGAETQSWRQCSASPGMLNTRLTVTGVELTGACELEAHVDVAAAEAMLAGLVNRSGGFVL